MTRINAYIKPSELPDKLLLAEHREIKRIPNTINSGRAFVNGIPQQFILGKGHVKFFYNKLLWLHNRYRHIYDECKARGFNVTDYSESFMVQDDMKHLVKDWHPNVNEIKRIRQLLIERIESKGFKLLS